MERLILGMMMLSILASCCYCKPSVKAHRMPHEEAVRMDELQIGIKCRW